MASATVLYTPQVLALAASLSDWSWNDSLPLQATVRSKSCGSTLTMGLSTDANGRIDRLCVKAHACAIGQAAAAIFARSAIGLSGADVARTEQQLGMWLAGQGAIPDWPGLDLLDAARAYPARHGAIMLAWQAARQLLPTGDMPR